MRCSGFTEVILSSSSLRLLWPKTDLPGVLHYAAARTRRSHCRVGCRRFSRGDIYRGKRPSTQSGLRKSVQRRSKGDHYFAWEERRKRQQGTQTDWTPVQGCAKHLPGSNNGSWAQSDCKEVRLLSLKNYRISVSQLVIINTNRTACWSFSDAQKEPVTSQPV